jgi:ornithine carbamoyltransferase
MINFLSLEDLSADNINNIIDMATILKKEHKASITRATLKNKSLALVFEKPSTRTYVSFQVAINQLQGNPITVHPSSLGSRESIHDVTKTLARYVDAIIVRTYSHDTLIEMAEHSSVPIINALTDKFHPCQALADYLTIIENFGSQKVKIAYIGDGFNVANTLLLLSSKVAYDISIASPKGFEPDQDAITSSLNNALQSNSKIVITNDPKEAIENADVVYTDTWTSMGLEKEENKRIKLFSDYQVNKELVSLAKENAIIMHCLPAHRGQEITDEVIDSNKSVIFDQAENRLWTQKAILELIFSKGDFNV